MKTKPANRSSIELLNLKGGVLIIGSLLWQDHGQGENELNTRKKWRDTQLLMDKKIAVKVPIRYGRLSRSDVYTMVFSNSCAKNRNGTGYFAPFKHTPIDTFNDLVKEASEISIAEGMKGLFIKKVTETNKAWSVLGILTNPNTAGQKQEKSLLKMWSAIIKSQGNFDTKDFKFGREKSCLTKFGKLNINWPTALDPRDGDIFNSYDFIIATVTKPTKYPSLKELFEKVKTDKTRNYFIKNYKSGITTFQDIGVINKL